MKRSEIKALTDLLATFVEPEHTDVRPAGGKHQMLPAETTARSKSTERQTEPKQTAVPMNEAEEKLYAKFKNRFIEDMSIDPVLLHLAATRPEIHIAAEPRVIELTEASLIGRVAKMIAKDFFVTPVRPGQVLKRLAETGGQAHPSRLSDMLGELVVYGFLERADGNTYVSVPGFKVTEKAVQR